jgi:hypothetical protein
MHNRENGVCLSFFESGSERWIQKACLAHAICLKPGPFVVVSLVVRCTYLSINLTLVAPDAAVYTGCHCFSCCVLRCPRNSQGVLVNAFDSRVASCRPCGELMSLLLCGVWWSLDQVGCTDAWSVHCTGIRPVYMALASPFGNLCFGMCVCKAGLGSDCAWCIHRL